MEISSGTTRTTFLIRSLAIKVPSLRNGPRYFVMGMLGNILESEHWNLHHHPQLAPVYHCGPLGLWLTMKRYKRVINRKLTDSERETLPFIGIDDNGANVAIEDGKLILFDYGNLDWFYMSEQ